VRAADDAEFTRFVAGSSRRLLGLAYLLSANRADAEDLLESALARTYRRWSSVSRDGVPEAHVRQLLVDATAGRRHRRHHVIEADPDSSASASQHDDRDEDGVDRTVMPAVAGLPSGQRAVLVLRHFERLDEAQAAAVLGWSAGAVRTQHARAIARLTAVLPSREA
jgi:RNA polymerase sigma-70 factor (sigma-E family)